MVINMNKKTYIILLVVGVSVLAGLFLSGRAAFGQTPEFPRDRLIIERADGVKIPYDVEVATTREQQEYGLMNRRSMLANSGMLFVFNPAQVVKFWMKNTYIPLDMVFVRADGTIAQIIRAEPLDLTPVGPAEAISGVIELNGGEAERQGVRAGDRVRYSVFE